MLRLPGSPPASHWVDATEKLNQASPLSRCLLPQPMVDRQPSRVSQQQYRDWQGTHMEDEREARPCRVPHQMHSGPASSRRSWPRPSAALRCYRACAPDRSRRCRCRLRGERLRSQARPYPSPGTAQVVAISSYVYNRSLTGYLFLFHLQEEAARILAHQTVSVGTCAALKTHTLQ